MPVETLRAPGGALPSAMPFRILTKGPGYFRRPACDPAGARKLSAVERLEADKAKYVKSQTVALTRQAPIQPPIIRKPLLSSGMMLQCRLSTPPARKLPRRPADSGGEGGGGAERGGRRGPHLNLEILNNLINNVCDGGPPSSSSPSGGSNSASSPSSGAKSIGSSLSAEPRPLLLLGSSHPPAAAATSSSSTSSCTSSSPRGQAPPPDVVPPSRRPPPVPARGLRVGPLAPYGSPNCVTVRRVDVRPQVAARKPQRPPLPPKPQQPPPVQPRQTAQPQAPPQQAQPQTPAKALPSPLPYLPPSPMLFRAGMLPPASPAFTRLSNASSRGSRPGSKHPSLHRSKSDLSDRYSRATADLERFFNYCGLDPQEVEGLGGVERFGRAASDIVSVSKMRSVSTPSSELGQREGEEPEEGEGEEGEGPAGANERIPYGISVIERNARVIKWLYGIRQARDGSGVSNV